MLLDPHDIHHEGKNDLLSRTENLVKKWLGILNSAGLASFHEPSNPENLPQIRLATTSGSGFCDQKKRKNLD